MSDKDLGTAAGDIFAKAFTFGYETGRKYVPAGGMALTAEEGYLAGKVMAALCTRNGYFGDPLGLVDALKFLESALFPATEPAEGADLLDNVRQCLVCGGEKDWRDMVIWRDADGAGHWVHPHCRRLPAPAEPAEEETKAEVCAVRLCVLPAEHSGVHADREGLRWNNPASSPVVPAPNETGPWQRIEDVPEGVLQIKDRHGRTWLMVGGTWRFEWHDGNWHEPHTNINAQDPFVAAAEGS